MTDDPVVKADEEMRFITEVAVLGMQDPSVWSHYMERWTADVKRRIDNHFPDTPPGSPGPDAGELPGNVPAEDIGN